jgi:hypothetical protein
LPNLFFNAISIIPILNARDYCKLEIYKIVIIFPKNPLLPFFDVSLEATVIIPRELARVFL